MRAAGLCHSDLSVIDGNRPRPLPMVLGHEGAGIVEELGAGVADLQVGDHVVTAFVPSCGHCGPCETGRPALCEPGAAANAAGTLLCGARRLHRAGADVNHHLGVSAFAEYATVSRNSLVRIDRSLDFAHAAVFGCAVITGTGAVINTADLPLHRSVAVVGLGGVGLAALLGARVREARTIVAIDLSPRSWRWRASSAPRTPSSPATRTPSRRARSDQGRRRIRVRDGGLGEGDGARVQGHAPRRHDRDGRPRRPQAMFSVPHVNLVAEERTIKGSYLGSCVPSRDIPRYIEWYQQGKLPVDRLLSETLALDDINGAFDRLARGEGVRQVVTL